MNITAATPAEIDTELARILMALERPRATRDYLARKLQAHHTPRTHNGDIMWEHELRETREKLDVAVAQIRELQAQAEPLEDEFGNRGGWTRSFLVTNAGGHAHRDRHCSTCRPTTQYAWLTELSGLDEAEIVELAGERACTVCYPSAPVDALKRPSQLRPDVEARAAREARQAELEAKRAAKAAKAIANPDGTPLKVRRVIVATEVSAQREYVDAAAMAVYYEHPEGAARWNGKRPELAAEYLAQAEQILPALAHKRGTTVDEQRDALAGKVRAKIKRDHGIVVAA